MAKFKVGDNVKILDTPNGVDNDVDYLIGEVHPIINVMQYDNEFWYNVRGWFYKENRLELSSPHEQKHKDDVNQPLHYTSHPSGIECIEIVEHMTFCLGNAIKYIWRAGLKTADPLKDLKKARFYIDREIERIENKDNKGK